MNAMNAMNGTDATGIVNGITGNVVLSATAENLVTESELSSYIEASSIDFDKLREQKESESSLLVRLRSSVDELNQIMQLNTAKIKLLSQDGDVKDSDDEQIVQFFDSILKNASNDEDRSNLIERNKLIMESKVLSLPVRICALNYAFDYVQGLNGLFSDLKQDIFCAKKKKRMQEIKILEDLNSSITDELNRSKPIIQKGVDAVEKLIEEIKVKDHIVRVEKAKLKAEESEREAQAAKERFEKERQEDLKRKEERKPEEEERVSVHTQEFKDELARRQQRLMDESKGQGSSATTAIVIDEIFEIMNADEQNEPTHKMIKKEEDGYEIFQRAHKEGRREVRERRKEKRKHHAIRRERGDPNVSDDDEFNPELDGMFSDDEIEYVVLDDSNEEMQDAAATTISKKQDVQQDVITPSPSYTTISSTLPAQHPSIAPNLVGLPILNIVPPPPPAPKNLATSTSSPTLKFSGSTPTSIIPKGSSSSTTLRPSDPNSQEQKPQRLQGFSNNSISNCGPLPTKPKEPKEPNQINIKATVPSAFKPPTVSKPLLPKTTTIEPSLAPINERRQKISELEAQVGAALDPRKRRKMQIELNMLKGMIK